MFICLWRRRRSTWRSTRRGRSITPARLRRAGIVSRKILVELWVAFCCPDQLVRTIVRAGEQIAGMVTAVDDSLGRMIHKLQAAGLYERSVILLTTGEQCLWPTPDCMAA